MPIVGFVSSMSFGSLLLIAFVALLIFGPKKLPDLGKAVGNSLREFKNATKGLADDDDDVKKIEKKDEVK
jgi:sec-independent protein translocase protein TatA